MGNSSFVTSGSASRLAGGVSPNDWTSVFNVRSLNEVQVDRSWFWFCVGHLEVQVDQAGLVEVVDSLQGLSDQAGDLGLRQQLLGHAEVEDLSACGAGQKNGRVYGSETDQNIYGGNMRVAVKASLNWNQTRRTSNRSDPQSGSGLENPCRTGRGLTRTQRNTHTQDSLFQH